MVDQRHAGKGRSRRQAAPPDAAEEAALADLAARAAYSLHAEIAGPVTLISAHPAGPGATACEIRANWQVRITAQEADAPGGAAPEAGRPPIDVWIEIPITGTLELTGEGTVRSASLDPPPADHLAEARLLAMDLLSQGAVRGQPPAAGAVPARGRPTHELVDVGGRRVLRRMGFQARRFGD